MGKHTYLTGKEVEDILKRAIFNDIDTEIVHTYQEMLMLRGEGKISKGIKLYTQKNPYNVPGLAAS